MCVRGGGGGSWGLEGNLEKLGEGETWEPGYGRGGPKLVGVLGGGCSWGQNGWGLG